MTNKLQWERIPIEGGHGNYYKTADGQGREWELVQGYGYEWDIKCDGEYVCTIYPPQALSEAKRHVSVIQYL